MVYTYTPLPGSLLYKRALECGYKEPRDLIGWSRVSYTPDDIFRVSCEHKWLTKKQYNTISMLEQYIFSLLDADTYELVSKYLPNGIQKKIFSLVYRLFKAFARYRLTHRFFSLPLDYWLFVQSRKFVRI